MSLLPIIYSSLIITGGLVLVAFTISYISYKFKNKGVNEKDEKIPHRIKSNNIRHSRQSTNYITQVPNNSNKRPAKIYREATPRKTVIISRESKISHSIAVDRKDSRRDVKLEKQYNSNNQRKVAHKLVEIKPDYMKKSSVGKIKHRLEIVNPITSMRNDSLNHRLEKRYPDYPPAERHMPCKNNSDKNRDSVTTKPTLFAQTGT